MSRIIHSLKNSQYWLVFNLLVYFSFLTGGELLGVAQTPPGSSISASASATYTTEENGQTIVVAVSAPFISNVVSVLSVSSVYDVNVSASGNQTTNEHYTGINSVIQSSFTIQNTGNETDTYQLSVNDSGDFTPVVEGIYLDLNYNGVIDVGEQLVPGQTLTLKSGESLSVLVRASTPVTPSNGDVARLQLRAESVTQPTVVDTDNFADIKIKTDQAIVMDLSSDLHAGESGDKVCYRARIISQSITPLPRSLIGSPGINGYLLSLSLGDEGLFSLSGSDVTTSENSAHIKVYSTNGGTSWNVLSDTNTITGMAGTELQVGIIFLEEIRFSQSLDLNVCPTIQHSDNQRYLLNNHSEFTFGSASSVQRSNDVPLVVSPVASLALASDVAVGPDGDPQAAGISDQQDTLGTLNPTTGERCFIVGSTYYLDLEVRNLSGNSRSFELGNGLSFQAPGIPLILPNNHYTLNYFEVDQVTPIVDSNGDGLPDTEVILSGATKKYVAAITLNSNFPEVTVPFDIQVRAYGRDVGDTSVINNLNFDFTGLLLDSGLPNKNIITPDSIWDVDLEFVGNVSGENGAPITIKLGYKDKLGFGANNVKLDTDYKKWIGNPIDPATGNPIPLNTPTPVTITDSQGGTSVVNLIYEENPAVAGEFRICLDLGNVPPLGNGEIEIQFSQLGEVADIAPSRILTLEAFLKSTSFAASFARSGEKMIRFDPQQLSVTKRALRNKVTIGDPVAFEINIKVEAGFGSLSNFIATDTLPKGLRFVPGSTVSNDTSAVAQIDPSGRVITWDFGSQVLGIGDQLKFVYRAIVTDEAQAERITNTIAVTSSLDPNLFAQTTETITVEGGVFTNESALVGQVYWDKDRNGRFTPGDEGLPKVVIQLTDGRRVVTDDYGRYHIPELETGSYGLRVYEQSLPEGLRLDDLKRLERGTRLTRLVDVTRGGLKSVNFRAVGEITKPVEVLVAPEENVPEERLYGIIEPETGKVVRKGSVVTAVVRYPMTAKPTILINGEVVDQQHYGNKLVFPKKRKIQQQLVGIPLREGKNSLTLSYKPLRGEVVEETIEVYRTGKPVKVVVTPVNGPLIADGQSNVDLKIELHDKYGLATGENRVLNISIDKGEIESRDFRPSAEGHQVQIKDIKAIIKLSKADLPETRLLTVVFNETTSKLPIVFRPANKTWQVAGVFDQRVGKEVERPNFQSRDQQHLSFLAQGPVTKSGSWQATIGFDSRRDLSDGRDFNLSNQKENNQYEVFGDDSKITNPFGSREPLYLRLDNENHKFVFGDIETGLSDSELARHNRKLTGATWRSEKTLESGARWSLNLFGAKDNTSAWVETIATSEIVSTHRLSRDELVANSEKIFLEKYERYRPTRIISREELQRGRDYNIDYITGRIYFNSVLSATDEDFNPYFVRVEYEVDSYDNAQYTYGGRIERHRDQFTLGTTYFTEESGIEPSEVTGVDLAYEIDDHTRFLIEAASSSSVQHGEGDAFKIKWESRNDGQKQSLSYEIADSTFHNQYGSGIQSGRSIVRWESEHQLPKNWTLGVDFDHEYELESEEVKQLLLTRLSKTFDKQRLTFKLGSFRGQNASVGPNEVVPAVGLDWNYNLTSSVAFELGGMYAFEELDYDLPTEVETGFSWQVTEGSRVRLGVKSRRRSDGDWRESLQLRVEKQIADGIDYFTQYGQKSLNTDDAPSITHGVNLNKDLTESWRYNATVETNQFLSEDERAGGSNTGRASRNYYTVGFGLDWQPKDQEVLLKTKFQHTNYDDENTTYAEYEYQARLNVSWSVLSRLRGSYSDYELSENQWYFKHELGAAYRPYDDDQFVFLGKIESEVENLGLGSGALQSISQLNHHTVSFEGYWRSHLPLELSMKYASRWSQLGDDSDWNHTDLKVVEALFPLWKRLDGVVGARWLSAYDAEYESYGAGVGLIYHVQEGLEVEVGYNLAGFDDPNYEQSEYWNEGAYLQLRWAFDEDSLRGVAKRLKR